MDRKTACEILGVPVSADKDTIRAAYRKKARLLHPDNNPSEEATDAYVLVGEAYELLMSLPKVREVGGDGAFTKKRSEQSNVTYRRTMHEKMDRDAEKRRRQKLDEEKRLRKEFSERQK